MEDDHIKDYENKILDGVVKKINESDYLPELTVREGEILIRALNDKQVILDPSHPGFKLKKAA